ncbi:BrnT family toxin [Sphingomonas sp.]|uniref:BrnT family toxin n=1 Tax=Sphingomonas sp. TaxID=28214 RepID=UPI0025F93488|nr:BrnT family toxin [Sphingomonas sp.]
MEIEFDPAKRLLTLTDRRLDFLDAPRLFESRSLTVVDDRIDYGEERFVSYGFIDAIAIALVWTDREGVMRIISMRKMHIEEIQYVGLD